jgi:enterochelin esterase family protein
MRNQKGPNIETNSTLEMNALHQHIRKALLWVLSLLTTLPLLHSFGAGEDGFYKLGPDSLPQEGVPNGKLVGPLVQPSEVFPGTQHTFWIYVPAQYESNQPAALMVFNDGQAMIAMDGDVRMPNVLDNLIWRREIPVIIAVFINPGRKPEQPEPSPHDWGDRNTNRPEEYNRLNDKYARVIIEEILPRVSQQYSILADPEMRAIAGSSS